MKIIKTNKKLNQFGKKTNNENDGLLQLIHKTENISMPTLWEARYIGCKTRETTKNKIFMFLIERGYESDLTKFSNYFKT